MGLCISASLAYILFNNPSGAPKSYAAKMLIGNNQYDQGIKIDYRLTGGRDGYEIRHDERNNGALLHL